MQAQRNTSYQFLEGAPGCGVGGFIQRTTVTRDQITTRIVHRWDDEIGKRMKIGTPPDRLEFVGGVYQGA
jgi:hypothetical protein